ncbi:MAG: hypothetical protein K2G24_03100 [Muribaculaceae bacterium]|nr:hypothetical protein [Muribaculaceae bacterium]
MATKKILCPYCFEEFQNSEALYQCESEERDADGEYRCRRITSMAYDRYWKGEDLPIRNVWPQKGGFLSKLTGPSLKAQRCDNCGYNSRRFVCPHCLNWLPTDMIEKGAEIISVIGSPSSGKTNYIVALIHQLSKYGYKIDLQVSATQIYRDGHKNESTQNRYRELDRRLFKDLTMLAKTPENAKDIPLIFHLSQQQTNKDIYLVFYDTAGEKFQENLKNNVRYLQQSSGVICVLDVLSISKVKKILLNKGFSEFAGQPSAPMQDIQYSLDSFEGDEKLYSKPFAFVFSKFDAIIDNKSDLSFNADEFTRGNTLNDSSYLKSGEVDLDKINAISEVIEQTMEEEWDEGDFRHFAHKWASKKNRELPPDKRNPNDPDNSYKFFGVSSLGGMPDDNMTLDEVKPYRVVDPLVWILYKLGQFKIPVKNQK